jgi:PEP-CTERM motif-containing protein
MDQVGEHTDPKALRRRVFLKQAVLSGAALQLGGLLGSAIITPASAQVGTTVPITDFTTVRITDFTTVPITFFTTVRITDFTTVPITFFTTGPITDITTIPITFFPPSDTPPSHAVPAPSTLALLLAGAGACGAAALIKRLRAAASTQAPTRSEDDTLD